MGRLGMVSRFSDVGVHGIAVDPHKSLGLADATVVGNACKYDDRFPFVQARKRIGGEALP